MLREKFAKKPEIAEANIKVLNDGFNYGANTHASVSTYKIESKAPKSKGLYTDINGNKATAYGLIAAAEKQVWGSTWVLILSLRLLIFCTN